VRRFHVKGFGRAVHGGLDETIFDVFEGRKEIVLAFIATADAREVDHENGVEAFGNGRDLHLDGSAEADACTVEIKRRTHVFDQLGFPAAAGGVDNPTHGAIVGRQETSVHDELLVVKGVLHALEVLKNINIPLTRVVGRVVPWALLTRVIFHAVKSKSTLGNAVIELRQKRDVAAIVTPAFENSEHGLSHLAFEEEAMALIVVLELGVASLELEDPMKEILREDGLDASNIEALGVVVAERDAPEFEGLTRSGHCW